MHNLDDDWDAEWKRKKKKEESKWWVYENEMIVKINGSTDDLGNPKWV